jgi:hypothetical protein
MVSTDVGMQMNRSDTQFSNADSPTFERREPLSNVTLDNLSQERKHELETVLIDEGIQID